MTQHLRIEGVVGLDGFSLSYLPIVKEYASRMGLMETLDRALNCGMHVSPGQVLLGEGLRAEQLGDDTLGRVHAYSTWKLFSEVFIQAFQNFGVDCVVVHHDTTSVSVWGEYRPSKDNPFHAMRLSWMAMRRTRKPMGHCWESFNGSWPAMGRRSSSMLPTQHWPPVRTSLSCRTTSASSRSCRETLAHAGNSSVRLLLPIPGRRWILSKKSPVLY